MSSTAPLRLGTRRSALALAQAELVASSIRTALGRDVELVPVTTQGDVSSAPITAIGGVGVFVSALRDALLVGEVDLAVHSLKDLPTEQPSELELIAIPERGDTRDALVAREGHSLRSLPAGAQIGTGSPRRAVQIKQQRDDLEVVDIRGNVDTRVRLVETGVVDAVVLAKAGLERLGRLDVITETLPPQTMLPAPGQGALAVEVLAGSSNPGVKALSALDDSATRFCVTAERSVLSALEAGCSAPVGALAEVIEQGSGEPELALEAVVSHEDGGLSRMSITAPLNEGQEAGVELAARLLKQRVTASTRDHL